MENDQSEQWMQNSFAQAVHHYQQQGIEITPELEQKIWRDLSLEYNKSAVNEDESNDRVQMVIDYALNLDSLTLKNLDYDPIAIAQYAADCCEDSELFDEDDSDFTDEEMAQVVDALSKELPGQDLDESSDDNFPFDRPYWTVNVSFPSSQISKKEMIAQQVEAFAQATGGSVEMSSEPSPGFEGNDFGL